jgi:DNA mismatch repair ATPase MutS
MQSFSLLWPAGSQEEGTRPHLEASCVRDLELDHTLAALTESGRERGKIREVLYRLCTDPVVITYRQNMLDDLWRHPALRHRLEDLLPDMSALEAYQSLVDRTRSLLQDVTWRLGELEQFVSCVTKWSDAFAEMGDTLRAEGWCTLRDWIGHTVQDAVYQNLRRELPDMVRTIRAKASVTIGVNLDSRLRPVAATLLSVNDQSFQESSFIDRLLGRGGEGLKGIGPIHSVPRLERNGGLPGRGRGDHDVNPLLVPLFRDLAMVLDTVCQPIARTLRQYVTLHSGVLAALSGDIAFYLAAVRLMTRLHDWGLPLCRPDIAPMSERVCELREAYNVNLALHRMARDRGDEAVVTNDVSMNDDGRIVILTGPNQGGKTTYTQMVGLCQVLAQAGLWVPAVQARISPVDGIYTHYPAEETLVTATGRFGDEAQRLSHLFAHATRSSLLLFNESLASTSPGESLYIAQDIVRILRRLGTRAIFTTHLHELAADVDQLNASTAGDSRIVSLVASRVDEGGDGTQRSYRIVPGPPIGRSYAREIASKYGIGYDQLTERLQQRGALE